MSTTTQADSIDFVNDSAKQYLDLPNLDHESLNILANCLLHLIVRVDGNQDELLLTYNTVRSILEKSVNDHRFDSLIVWVYGEVISRGLTISLDYTELFYSYLEKILSNHHLNSRVFVDSINRADYASAVGDTERDRRIEYMFRNPIFKLQNSLVDDLDAQVRRIEETGESIDKIVSLIKIINATPSEWLDPEIRVRIAQILSNIESFIVRVSILNRCLPEYLSELFDEVMKARLPKSVGYLYNQ